MATSAVVVSWEGGDATRRCVASLLAQEPPLQRVVVADNASGAAERTRLQADWGAEPRVRLLLLDDNRQFAGGMNAGAEAAFADGAARVLLLNNDVELAPGAVAAMDAALDADPGAGIAGPVVLDRTDGDAVLSVGERHGIWCLCLPRRWLRPRHAGTAPHRVPGLMGCALLVTRACFTAVGGFSREIEVYYEDVDFVLGARAHGFAAVLVPGATIRHDGMRGFAAGLTPWAAYLKARNPWVLVRRRGSAAGWLVFVPTYVAMLAASWFLWRRRGRRDVADALARGAWAGLRAALGAPVTPAGAPAGRQPAAREA